MGDLIGRTREQEELGQALVAAQRGEGGLMLLAGDAGIGKTRLAEEVLRGSGLLTLPGAAVQEATAPYGPVVDALRAYLRVAPDGLRECGPLTAYLPLLLPELGPAPVGGDRPTIFEAIRCALATIARRRPTALLLDDLHWADDATLDLLPALARTIEDEPLLVVGTYRTDEIPRGHPLRRMRTDLRRAGRLREIILGPLDREGTRALGAQVLGRGPGPRLATALYDRTQGVPFFVEELATALAASGRLRTDTPQAELAGDEDVPIPDTVRDAVLLRTESLSEAARRSLEVAAVAGTRFDLDLVAVLSDGEDGLGETIEHGLVVEVAPGEGAFRHALAREAVYGELTWVRRRHLHRALAERLVERGGRAALVAEHWLASREHDRARAALAAAVDDSCALHAYRDAARAARRAIDLWPEGEDEASRLALLDRLAHCAQLSGDLAEAARAWREVVEGRRIAGDGRGAGEAERRLAGVYEMQGARDRALAARQAAAEAFADAGLPGEAAAERLAAVNHLQRRRDHEAALEAAIQARTEAQKAKRDDLHARALGLEGAIRAELGQIEAGLAAASEGLALALDRNLPGAAVDNYLLLADVLEYAADYPAARDAYLSAYGLCEARGEPGLAHVCLGCLANIVFRTGEWDRALDLCREVLGSTEAPEHTREAATFELASIFICRGDSKRARPLLLQASTLGRRRGSLTREFLVDGALARVHELEGDDELATGYCRRVLDLWERTGDRHFTIPDLRWSTTFFARRGLHSEARACARALSQIAAETAQPEALAGLAFALGEIAFAEGDAARAALQFEQALEILRPYELPFDHAQIQFRAGTALAAAGERATGIDRLTDAYRIARRLGARPLAEQAARELARLGESVERRLGRQAAAHLTHGGLSRREVEVVRLLAVGRTNREIAAELFLSPRTVDMHVRNILGKLACRTRGEAAHKAASLGLLA